MSEKDFVTVVSVEDAPFVTVVEVEEPFTAIVGREETSPEPPVEEEIQLYKLPGERLGFGLKFDGGPTVYGLTIESTAEGSPSARARASWGPLGPGDCILAVDGRPVAGMTRQEVVGYLTESGMVVTLLVRRGPPPVPPRRQPRRRLPGPPPPPRPFPRAPPRLVDFLPKDNTTRAVGPLPEDSSLLKCSIAENTHKIEINGQGLQYKQENKESLEKNFQDSVKDKVTPLKTLNPKLISLFEHSQPSDTNNKTSHINNNLWKNDKCRKSVKDKIAIFSCESNNNFENKIKHKENSELIQVNENIQTGPKKLHTMHLKPMVNSKPDKHLLPKKISITNTKEESDVNVNSHQSIIQIDTASKSSSLIDHNSSTAPTTGEALSASSSTLTLNGNNISLSGQDNKSTVSEQVSLKSETSKYTFLKDVSDKRKKSSKINEKNVTKLRGLVIPENLSRISTADQILDLPEIKSNNLFPGLIKNVHDVKLSHSFDLNLISSDKSKFPSSNSNSIIHPPSFQWKTQVDQDIPKYSPAFKRKSLSVFGTKGQFADSQTSIRSEDTNEKASSVHNIIMNDIPDTTQCDMAGFASDESNKSLPSSLSLGKDDLNSPLTEHDGSDSQTNCDDTHRATDEEGNDLINEINILRPFNTLSDNHSRSSSFASETELSQSSEYSIAGMRKMKEPLETKMDSLLSQDMSDSGNHSIPSNYSKSKNNSSDGSMCSLVNGENQDSDDTSVNYSSDEGHFIEFNVKTTEVSICRKTNETISLDSKDNPQSINSDSSIKEYRVKGMKTDVTFNNSKCYSPKEPAEEETKKKNTLKNDSSSISEKNNYLKNIESLREHSILSYRANEDRKGLDEVSIFKINHFNKMRSVEIKNNNDYGSTSLTKDNNDDLCTLNSPNSDLQKENHFASITSLASSTSLISQQELCQLIEESNDSSIDDNNGSPEISVIVLHRDTAEGSIGITLAGGIDYESKDITVHKVLHGSSADRDGRIKKGHRILSINGKSMKGLTHSESMAVLKAPRHEVVLVVARTQGEFLEENNNISQASLLHPSDTDSLTLFINPKEGEAKWGPILTITLKKEGAGLGFSLKGGKDSPNGDQPITVQKIFTGGCADKSGHIFAGDEILNINSYDLTSMTRVEAWTLMKRLPDGEVLLKIRHPVE